MVLSRNLFQQIRLAENFIMFRHSLGLAALSIVLLGLSLQSSNVFAEVALVNQSGGFLDAAFDQTLGWSFHLNTEVTLTMLGVYDVGHDGFEFAPDVGLWTTSGVLISSNIVPVGLSGSLLGNFRYVQVPSVVLPVGDYVIGAYYRGGINVFEQDSTVIQTHPYVEYTHRAGAGFGFVFPTVIAGPGSGNFFTSNFQFNIVPEPSSAALLGMGGLAMLGCVIRHRRCSR